jgi:hypothetical protein
MFSLPKRIKARLFEYRYEPLLEKPATTRSPDDDTRWIDVSCCRRQLCTG